MDIIDPCLNEVHNSSLNQPILDDEVLRAAKSIGALKAPGPNGIQAIFYQNCWDIVGQPITNMVKDFFSTCSSLRLINHTHIALIPKVDNPKVVSNFRPISLCNVTYKIITKIMFNQIKPLLTHCIFRNQGAFAPGRSIQDNACLAKLGWKVLIEEQNWWVQIVKNKYLKKEEFLSNKVRHNYSCVWKGILKTRDVIKMGLRWVWGNGEKYSFLDP